MTVALTALEQAVLAAIVTEAAPGYPSIAEIVRTARGVERKNTGHGFYTKLSCETAGVPKTAETRFDGPFARMNDMGRGATMGFILWCEDGYPERLEGYQNGDEEGQTVDLKTRDLAALSFESFFWF